MNQRITLGKNARLYIQGRDGEMTDIGSVDEIKIVEGKMRATCTSDIELDFETKWNHCAPLDPIIFRTPEIDLSPIWRKKP